MKATFWSFLVLNLAANVLVPTLSGQAASGNNFYVAPTGTVGGNGSINQPWDLATALKHPSSVAPGDTIWLRGGVYGHGGSTLFISNLTGTASKPILVRQYPGERATIDGGIRADGGFTWYWGFEITNSSTARLGSSISIRPAGLALTGKTGGNKAINLIIHNTGHPGITFNYQADQGEIYGCVIWGAGVYDTSWSGATPNNPLIRGDGVYAQNNTGIVHVDDNIFFRNFTHGAKAYAEGGQVKGFRFTGNISFENGDRGLFMATNSSGLNPVENLVVTDNYVYQVAYGFKTLHIGYRGTNKDAIVTRNYLVGADSGTTAAFSIKQFQNLLVQNNTSVGVTPGKGSVAQSQNQGTISWDGNTYHGGWATPFRLLIPGSDTYEPFLGWKAKSGFDAHSTHSKALPTGTRVFVRPNKYEGNRANIAIYNWDSLSSVPVDLSGVIAAGTAYEIRDVQNYFGPPIVSGVYNGGLISIPMNLKTVAPLVGAITHMPTILHTAPDFGAFVVLPKTASSSPSPSPGVTAPVINPGGGSFTSPVTVSLSSTTTGSTIHYTTDGSTPTASSKVYTAPFTLSNSGTVRALAVKSGLQNSTVTSASFQITSTTTDTTAPVITNVVVTPSTTGATVTWTTNENADGEIRYGTTTSYGLTTGVAPSLVTLHSATLSGLTAGQTYNLQVRSKDAAGNVGISGPLSFKTQSTTQSGSDKTGPVLSNILERPSQTSATVTWTTNEAARSQVLYGLTTKLGSITSLTSTLTTSHSVTLTGLKPNTIYYYRLRSVDASGNVTTTAHLSLRTTK